MAFKERLFLMLSAIFLCSLVMANIIGVTKFFTIFGLNIPVGIIPYPITFLATDLVCELYGKSRANYLVLTGFFMNIFLLIIMTAGYYAPVDQTWLNSVLQSNNPGAAATFDNVYGLMIRGTAASMIAYLTAQLIDVRLFHFWKDLTKGKHLWLRNNGSTMISQLVDTSAVTLIIFVGVLPFSTILEYIFFGYIFKFFFALFDTPFFYLFVKLLKNKVGEESA
ncbi:MAG: queuosine precursor transporter [Calditrichaeota bacterium]|nr:queuosine precursor transporter [Calditrichota bacterium]